MGWIENTYKRVKELDKLLTSITMLIKKHWIILTVITIGALAYYLVNYNGQQIPVATGKTKVITDTVKVKEIIDTVKVYQTENDSTQ